MNQKRWFALLAATMIFLFSFLGNWATSSLSGSSNEDASSRWSELFGVNDTIKEEVLEPGNDTNRIVVLSVNGTIQDSVSNAFTSGYEYNHATFMKHLNEVLNNDSIGGLILNINSPGGGVAECAEIHNKLMQIKEKKKPIYASMRSQATSGGYYIATAADQIFASEETMTGSLGVIIQSLNLSGLAEKYGIELVTVKSGPFKDILSPYRKNKPEEVQIIQNMVDNSYNGFVDVIADGRGMSVEDVKKLADGRIYDGRQAKENNLIDEFGYLEDTIASMRELDGFEKSKVVSWNEGIGLSSLFSVKAQSLLGMESEIPGLLNMVTQAHSPRLMYLYTVE